jgi:hypothetical protein
MTAPATAAHDTGVFDLDDEAYFTSPLARASLSSTGARELLKPGGPARFRHHMDAGTLEVRREFDVGHAVHTLVLGAGPQPITVVGTGKGGPNAWQNQADKDLVAQARAAGRVPLRPADMAAAEAMAAAVRAHPIAAKLLTAGQPERTLIWRDPATGVLCRAKADWLRPDGIVDLKTTESAAPDALSKAAHNYGYAIQAPFYLRGHSRLPHAALQQAVLRPHRSRKDRPLPGARQPAHRTGHDLRRPEGVRGAGDLPRLPPSPASGPATRLTRSPTLTCPPGCGPRSTHDRHRDSRPDDTQPTGTDLELWARQATAAAVYAERVCSTTMAPQQYRGKPAEAAAAILAGAELGFSPMASLRAFDNIQGTPAPKAMTLRAVVQAAGHQIRIVESTAERAVVDGRRKGETEWNAPSIWDVERAKKLPSSRRTPTTSTTSPRCCSPAPPPSSAVGPPPTPSWACRTPPRRSPTRPPCTPRRSRAG